MQIVYISNRPTIAAATLDYAEALMPFLSEALLVCPQRQADDFGQLTRHQPPRRLTLQVVPEETLLGDRLEAFRRTSSHVVKNWLLRSSLPTLPNLGDEFILSDDDYRPLFEIPLGLFVESGRYHSYYNFELSQWRADETDYDVGQRHTGQSLSRRGFATLSYSSHMPQMIRTSILAEVTREFAEETERGEEIEEWSLYFNTARARHPELFHPPRPFRTLCWPALPTDWEFQVRPGEPCFENYYPDLYAPGGLFEGIPEHFDATSNHQHADEKIRRRTEVQRVYDSHTAAALRWAAWTLRRLLCAGDARLAASSTVRRILSWGSPGPLRRFAQGVMLHGDDPAWSFPRFKTRYHSRRGSLRTES